MLINFTIFPSEKWDARQLEQAGQWGQIMDLPFPAVPAEADEKKVAELADTYVSRILALKPVAVLCQGEFTLSYAVISRLLQEEITVLAAVSERVSEEVTDKDGVTRKVSVFRFVRFRKYEKQERVGNKWFIH